MRIKCSYAWCIVFPLVISLHLEKVLLFIFLLLSIHESMHIIIARCFGYEVSEVRVYPFGLVAHIRYFEYKNSFHEILIVCAGLLVHVVAISVLQFLCSLHVVSIAFQNYLQGVNMQLLMFNLLPIYPLDGGRIIRSLLEYVFPFVLAKKISMYTSCILVAVYIHASLLYSLSGMLLVCLFCFQYGLYILSFSWDVHQFYMYRLLHPVQKRTRIHRKKDIYKNVYNVVVKDKQFLSEKQFLQFLIHEKKKNVL